MTMLGGADLAGLGARLGAGLGSGLEHALTCVSYTGAVASGGAWQLHCGILFVICDPNGRQRLVKLCHLCDCVSAFGYLQVPWGTIGPLPVSSGNFGYLPVRRNF